MKAYEKPMIIKVEDVAESVYMASGATGGSSAGNGISYTVSVKSQGNEWYKVNTYQVIISNHSENDASEWKVELTVSGSASNAQIDNSYVASATLNGNKITITPGQGGAIKAGEALTVDVTVYYDTESITVS